MEDKKVTYYRCPICDAVLDTEIKGWVFAMKGHRRKHYTVDGYNVEETKWVKI